MLSLNCTHPGKNDMRGGELFVNMQFAPAGTPHDTVPVLQTQPPAISSEKARNWKKVSEVSQL